MGITKLEQLIDDIIEFVESCKTKGWSQTQVVVPKDELYDLLDELRLRIPDEIKRYQKIIVNRDAIISDAEKKAEEIKEAARKQANEIVSENAIMKQVYQEANDIASSANSQAEAILYNANHDAEEIRSGALFYTNDILQSIEHAIKETYESTKDKVEALVDSLRENLEIVTKNRLEINEQISPSKVNGMRYDDYDDYDQDEDEDYNFPEDKFLEGID